MLASSASLGVEKVTESNDPPLAAETRSAAGSHGTPSPDLNPVIRCRSSLLLLYSKRFSFGPQRWHMLYLYRPHFT